MFENSPIFASTPASGLIFGFETLPDNTARDSSNFTANLLSSTVSSYLFNHDSQLFNFSTSSSLPSVNSSNDSSSLIALSSSSSFTSSLVVALSNLPSHSYFLSFL